MIVDNPVENKEIGCDPGVDFAAKAPDYLDICDVLSKSIQDSDLQQSAIKSNVAAFLYNSGYGNKAEQLMGCGQKWVPFSCSKGHKIYRRVTCGLPYCPTCGKKGSWLNKRKARRVRDVLLGYKGGLGHVVFTIPKELSDAMPSSAQLNHLYKKAYKLLSEWMGAEAAVIVLHFCGDKAKGLHLHLDCTFPILHPDQHWYSRGILDQIRFLWTVAVNCIFKTGFKHVNAVVHYTYAEKVEQQLHLISYVTRSTIPAEQFLELSDDQKKYILGIGMKKVTRYFGGLTTSKKKAFLEAHQDKTIFAQLDNNTKATIDRCICPICNEKMKPGLPVHMDDIPLINMARFNSYTLIDREIAAHIRDKDKKESRAEAIRILYSNLSFKEKLEFQEIRALMTEILERDPYKEALPW